MNSEIRVACLQMTSSTNVEQNLEFVDQHLERASQAGVQLLLLPENFAQMPAHSDQQHIEQAGSGLVQDFLAIKARQYEITLIAGSLPVRLGDNDKPFARTLVYDHSGSLISTYDKVHLYDVDLSNGESYRESAMYASGPISQSSSNLSVTNTELGKLGLSICYDLRFPEMYRQLTDLGAEIITVPSAFTYQTGKTHWSTLLRARAIENQAFVIAAAQTGTHENGRRTWGHSVIVDPWGIIQYQLDTLTGLLIGTIDLTKLVQLRNDFPALAHRRL